MKLSQIEKDKLKIILKDPILWAKAFIVTNDAQAKKMGPWTARPYQAEMLRDSSYRKVYRCGRRCLPEWVEILDPTTGELKTVGELFKVGKAKVATMTSDHKIGVEENCDVFYNGFKKVYRLKTKNGKEIDLTDNHPLYTIHGWRELKDLNPGDKIAVPNALPYFGNKKMARHFLDTLIKEMMVPKAIVTLNKNDLIYFVDNYIHQYSKNNIVIFNNPEFAQNMNHVMLRLGYRTILKKEDCKIIILDRFEEDVPGINWEEISSIEYLCECDTYDLSVDNTHNFVANDIITHNTGKTDCMIIEGMHKAFVNKGFRVLYVAPYENQINSIFMRMKEIISNSPLVDNEVVSMKNSPYSIQFKNGSYILGFTTGAATGAGAASVICNCP